MGPGFFGILIRSGIVMLVWNYLIPDLFDGPMTGYFQALLLVVLGQMLTGRGRGGSCRHQGGHHWKARFREKMKEKMAGMSPEDREKFRRGFTTGKWDVNVIEIEEEETEAPEPEEGEAGEEGNKTDQ